MKRQSWHVVVLIMALGIVPAMRLRAGAQTSVQPQVVPGEYVIKWQGGSAGEQQAVVAAQGGRIVDRIPELGLAAVRFDPPTGGIRPAADVIDAMQREPLVAAIAPNAIVQLSDENRADPTPDTRSGQRAWLPLLIHPGLFLPDDPGRAQQYAWERIGAYAAWQYTQGSPDVVVAIIDTGVQLDHPDLAAKIVPGYDFVDDDATPSDQQGHGTHVAGTVGAITNNGIGVAGTCPLCKIMPVRVLDANGYGSEFDVAKGMVFAATHGAKVINLSVTGRDGVDGSGRFVLEDAVNYAWNQGVVLACAAGNEQTSAIDDALPAAYERCIAVGATNSDDSLAYYSNWGAWVDIAAPGTSIYSTALGGGYTYKSGTSMATPHVAGAAGLLVAQGLNNVQVRERLEKGAEPIAGTGEWWMNGRLNLYRALLGN